MNLQLDCTRHSNFIRRKRNLNFVSYSVHFMHELIYCIDGDGEDAFAMNLLLNDNVNNGCCVD